MSSVEEIIETNKNLIYKIAHKFKNYDIEDLYQVGCIGIMKAYKKFDNSRGVKFTTFAFTYILGEMKQYIRECRGIKVSKEINTLVNKIEKASSLLTQKLMKEPTIKELSQFLEIEEEQIIEAYNSVFPVTSIEKEDYSLYDLIGEETDINTLIALKTSILKLPEPDRSIIIQRYFEDSTQSVVANNLGLKQVDVSRREKKTLKKIKTLFDN